MTMTASSMKAKIAAAYTARTGKTMEEGDFNALIDICQGIIDELTLNAVIAMNGNGLDTNGDTLVSNVGTIS